MAHTLNAGSKLLDKKILWSRKMAGVLNLPQFANDAEIVKFTITNYRKIKKAYPLNQPNFNIDKELTPFHSGNLLNGVDYEAIIRFVEDYWRQKTSKEIMRLVGVLESDHKMYKHKPLKCIGYKTMLVKIILPTLKTEELYKAYVRRIKTSKRSLTDKEKFKVAKKLLEGAK